LVGNPSITHFKLVHQRYTPFAMHSSLQSSTTPFAWGKDQSFLLAQNGDLLTGCTLQVELPTNQHWKPGAALAIIKEVRLQVNGQTLDRISSEYIKIHDELRTDAGKLDALEISHGIGGSGKRQTCVIDVPFFFAKECGLALPLISLQHRDVVIVVSYCTQGEARNFIEAEVHTGVDFEGIADGQLKSTSAMDLTPVMHEGQRMSFRHKTSDEVLDYIVQKAHLSSNTDGDTVIGYNLDATEESTYSASFVRPSSTHPVDLPIVDLFCDVVYLSEPERQTFLQNSHEYLIEQHQRYEITVPQGTSNEMVVSLPFHHAVKEMLMVSAPTAQDPHTAFGFDACGKGILLHDRSSNEPNTLAFRINGNKLQKERGEEYYTQLSAKHYHTRISSTPIYVISLCLHPESHQPSGAVSFNTSDTAELLFKFSNPVSETYSLHVHAVNYNVLKLIAGNLKLSY